MLNLITAFTSGCFFLLAFVLAINPKQVNTVANRWLALFLFLVGVILIDDPLIDSKFYHRYPIFIGWINIAAFAVAPTLYLAILNFVSPARPFRKTDLAHYIPAFLMALLMVLYMFAPAELKIKELEKVPNSFQNIIEGFILIILPVSIYWFFSYKKLQTHQKNIRLFASNTEGVDLAWLRYFLGGVVAMILAWASDMSQNTPLLNFLNALIYLSAAYFLAYFALKQGAIFSEKPQEIIEIKTIIEENEQPNSIKKQVINPEQISILKEKLTNLMVQEKPYLDSDLSLPKLANKMQLGTHELSYLINTGFEDNFFNFVNRYRVEESKRILMTPQYQHLSMVGIAFEAGFNSKTAFNTAFKKITGMSPSEFQKLNIR